MLTCFKLYNSGQLPAHSGGWLAWPWLSPRYWPHPSTCLRPASVLNWRVISYPPTTTYSTAGSFPGRDCESVIACFTIIIAHTYTRKCEKVYEHPEHPFQIWSKLQTQRDSRWKKLFMLITLCPHVVWQDTPHISLNRKFSVSLWGMKRSLIWAEVVNHSAQAHQRNKLLLTFGIPHLLFKLTQY